MDVVVWMCAELACRQCERVDQLLTSTTQSVVSPSHENLVEGSRYEFSQASITNSRQ